MPRIFMGPQCKKKPKIQVLFQERNDEKIAPDGVRTELTEQGEGYSPPGTPCSSTDGLDTTRMTSPKPAPVQEEVTSTTSGSSPAPIEIIPRGERELRASESSAFRRISLESHQRDTLIAKERHHIDASSYLAKARQAAYDDHLRLLHYPIPPRSPLDIPSSPRSHYHPHHPHPSLTPREHDPLLMSRYELPYLHMAHASLPRLDLIGYTDPRMPITNYYLTAARMRYEQHQQAMMAALSRGSLDRKEERRAFSPALSPRKSEIDTIKTPGSDRHKRSPSSSETASSPESVSSAQAEDLSRKRKYSSSNDHQMELECSPFASSSTLSSPTDSRSAKLGLPVEPYLVPMNQGLSPPLTAACSSPPGPPATRHPLLPGFPSPLEARYNRPISPPSFSMLPAATSTPVLPRHPGLFYPGMTSGRHRDPTKPPALKKYKCDICAKSFSRSNTLVTHKRIHTGEKPFKCELCGRAFRQPGNLTRHRLTHTTVKPYVCPVCKKAFNRASNLHTHMRTHTNYRPYVCGYCGKGFHQKIDMKIHSYTHTAQR